MNNKRLLFLLVAACSLCSFSSMESAWAKKKKVDFPSQAITLKLGEKTFLSYPGLKSVLVENSAIAEAVKDTTNKETKNNVFSLKAKARGSTRVTMVIQIMGNRGKPQKILIEVVVK